MMKNKIYVLLIVCLVIEKISSQNCDPIVLDLALIVDVSASIGNEYFELGRDLMLNIINMINAPKNSINLSILTYSSGIKVVRETVNSVSAKDSVISSIKMINYENPLGTSTASSIRYISNYVFNTRRGNAPRIAIIITDGLFDHAEMAANSIKQETNKLIGLDVEVFSMPIADQNNYGNIKDMVTSTPIDQHFILPTEMKRLYEILNDQTVKVCDANAFRFLQ